MSAFGFGELHDGGGGGDFNGRGRSFNDRRRMSNEHDPRLKLARGMIPQGL